MYAENLEFSNPGDALAQIRPPLAESSGKRQLVHARLQRVGALYGACPAMQRLFQTIGRLGPSDATVMVLGESGSELRLAQTTLVLIEASADLLGSVRPNTPTPTLPRRGGGGRY